MDRGCASSCRLPSKVPKSHDGALMGQIRRLIEDEFGVGALVLSDSRRRTYAPQTRSGPSLALGGSQMSRSPSIHEEPWWPEVHADYYESARFAFSSVLYLGEEADDPTPRVGGQTGIADALRLEADGSKILERGVIVEPRRGRLLLFSGGGENYHSPQPVLAGRRTTLHAWFSCACDERWTRGDGEGT